jgi:hypothetical protein
VDVNYRGGEAGAENIRRKLNIHIKYTLNIHIHTLTYLLTPCSRVLLEKLTGSKPVNKFPAFYGT